MDFLITNENCTILLEVKSQDLSAQARVFPDNKNLKRQLEDSIIKATIQAYSTVNKLLSFGEIEGNKIIFPPYLFILTYKDLYLGNGRMIWDEFLKSAIEDEINDMRVNIDMIPPEKIVVLSIREFDLLMSCLQKQNSIAEILNTMIEENTNNKSMKWTFDQNLAPYTQELIALNYLDEKFDSTCNRIESLFQKD